MSLNLLMVPGVGLEPTRIATADFESQNYGFRQIVQGAKPHFNWFLGASGLWWFWASCTKLHEERHMGWYTPNLPRWSSLKSQGTTHPGVLKISH